MRRSNKPSQITIDASALVELLLKTPVGLAIARIVAGTELIAPDIINPEVTQSLRNSSVAASSAATGRRRRFSG